MPEADSNLHNRFFDFMLISYIIFCYTLLVSCGSVRVSVARRGLPKAQRKLTRFSRVGLPKGSRDDVAVSYEGTHQIWIGSD